MIRQGRVQFLILLGFLMPFSLLAEQGAALPIPQKGDLNPDRVQLGRLLYQDPLFSQDNSLSCNSCHSLQKAGVDNLPRYIGMNKIVGTLNTPTVLNSKFNFRQFWDRRAENFTEVIDDHINDRTVFANDWETILQRINEKETYKKAFQKAYAQEKVTSDLAKDAISTFLDSLVTPDSPFDRYLNGDKAALSPDAIKGYELFQQYGCITCHEGINLGGNLFQRLGIYQEYYANRTTVPSDYGLYNLTKKEEDKHVFKVPSLRNIELTGPYLHDGSVQTLEEMIEIMGVYQVGQPIPPFHVPYLVKFLQSLNGVQAEK